MNGHASGSCSPAGGCGVSAEIDTRERAQADAIEPVRLIAHRQMCARGQLPVQRDLGAQVEDGARYCHCYRGHWAIPRFAVLGAAKQDGGVHASQQAENGPFSAVAKSKPTRRPRPQYFCVDAHIGGSQS